MKPDYEQLAVDKITSLGLFEILDLTGLFIGFGLPGDWIVDAIHEHCLMSVLWEDVQRHCGASAGVRCVPAPPSLMSSGNMGAAVFYDSIGDERDRVFGYGIGSSSVWSNDQTRAAMAHELGHIVNGDLDAKRNDSATERAADAFAAKHGFALDLAAAVEISTSGISDDLTCSDGLHVRTSERVAVLRLAVQS